jgi:hypothetical protein
LYCFFFFAFVFRSLSSIFIFSRRLLVPFISGGGAESLGYFLCESLSGSDNFIATWGIKIGFRVILRTSIINHNSLSLLPSLSMMMALPISHPSNFAAAACRKFIMNFTTLQTLVPCLINLLTQMKRRRMEGEQSRAEQSDVKRGETREKLLS